MENSIEEIEELKRLLYRNELTQYGKRKLISYYEKQEKDYKRVLKENEELAIKIDDKEAEIQGLKHDIKADEVEYKNVIENLKKENEKLNEKILSNTGIYELGFRDGEKRYIQKIREKIEEITQKIKYEENEKVLIQLHKQRKVLQELLEGRK